MKPPQLGSRVSHRDRPDLNGYVIAARDDGRLKVLWHNYASSWHEAAELVTRRRRRRRRVSADERR